MTPESMETEKDEGKFSFNMPKKPHAYSHDDNASTSSSNEFSSNFFVQFTSKNETSPGANSTQPIAQNSFPFLLSKKN